jgi:hypothetical protein
MSVEPSIENDLLKSNEYFISTRFTDSNLQRVASDPIIFQQDDNISMPNSTMSLPNRSRQPLIATINSNSSSDSTGSIRKSFIDKSTMTNIYSESLIKQKIKSDLTQSKIQKPRVYTSDNRNLPIPSSSSGSSILSSKDKNLKEVGETKYI